MASPCSQCQVLYISGHRCHEHGCPEAWKDCALECRECGQDFMPEERHQTCCCASCHRGYHGLPDPEDPAHA